MAYVWVSMLEFKVSYCTHTYFVTHNASLLSPSFISSYITSKQAVGHYYRGFPPEDLEWLIGHFHTSSLGLVPKLSSDSFCMIWDMSFLHSRGILSMNQGINSDDFPTTWGSFEATSALILSLPSGCTAATFNISAAYHLTPIHPDQQQHFASCGRGRYMLTRQLCSDYPSRVGVFGCVADMLVAIYKAAGFHSILKWVNNFSWNRNSWT